MYFAPRKTPPSPYINRFVQPDTLIPDLSNPQSWNRYSYVTNRPVNFSDPTGHREVSGCSELAGGCNITQKIIDDDAQKLALLEKENHKRKCESGNKAYCSTALEHPLETTLFVFGGLFLAGTGTAVVTYTSAAEAAAMLNAGISTVADCVTTLFDGGSCSAKNAAITAGFSLVSGGIRGRVTSWFTLQTAESIAGAMVANGVIQVGSNTLQRTVKGEATQEKHVLSDWGSGLITTSIQFAPGDIYALSHLAEAAAGIFDAIGVFNPESGSTLISGRDE